ncbi:MAG TPA: Gldg family protein, partial [Pirellulaceae bacterium]|nr:Gldg family protein [Pirellulaceae bacterium]
MQMIFQMLKLLAIDAALVGVLALALTPLMVFRRAAFAVLKRNFVGYFSNPTGYMFLCVFVLLTTYCAFWPNEFFSANLANLDQLNTVLPLVMLLYIPSITMSIWSEERRQGTDELLLTLPADDFDIVVGKYLAAAAIFTASLLFSQLSNFAVLVSLTLGELDVRLLFATYLGYWLMGLAMLAIGMVASFLTSNLSISFVLGALFNVPLVALYSADRVIAGETWAQRIKQWSLAASIDDFTRGVVTFSGVLYFGMIIMVGIYVSMILVGRRHWMGGRDGQSLLGHYLVRALALVVIALSANVVFSYYDPVRLDLTEGRVSSLSPATIKLVRNLETKSPVKIEAFISSSVPEDYLKTRHDLVSMLKEFQRLGGSDVRVVIHENVEPFSEMAQLAEQRYGIKPQRINTRSRGSFKDEQVMLGAAFTCGLEKIVVPFFEYGVPVEYELVRSIATVARGERYRIGVVRTDAQLMGGISGGGMMMQPQSIPKRGIITELEQQYTVEEVDPNGPIDAEKYDALLLVQPSTLTPPQLPNVLAAIQAGVPTAIFEDPLSVFLRVPGTGEPKRPASMFQQEPQEKCNINQLWELIGLQILGQQSGPMYEPDVVWQTYNPYPQLGFSALGPEFVFVCANTPGVVDALSSTDPVTSGLEEVLFPFPGGLKRVSGTGLEFEKMCVTSPEISGAYPFSKWMADRNDPIQLEKDRGLPSGEKVVAARIYGKRKDAVMKMADDQKEDKKSAEKSEKKDKAAKKTEDKSDKKKERKAGELSVIYVADVDCLGDEFLGLRNRPDEQFNFRFDNITFALNILDSLVGDDRFIEIRKRKLRYSTLKLVEAETARIREEEKARAEEFNKEFDEAVKKARDSSEEQTKFIEQKQKELEAKRARGEDITLDEFQTVISDVVEKKKVAEQQLEQERRRLQAKRDNDIEKTRRDQEQGIQRIQSQYKMWAV